MVGDSKANPFSLGIGLTNACDLECAHCYRGTGTDRLGMGEVLRAVDAVDASSVNLGTGESALHPEFVAIVAALLARGAAVTMTTNGHSARALPDALLARLWDVEFSIDYPSREEHDGARGPGNWDLVRQQMARSRSLGVRTTIATVMMSSNYDRLPQLARLAAERDAALRVNVYQSVRTDRYALDYAKFWDGWRRLLAVADVVTCAEPIVRAMLDLPRTSEGACGEGAARITPRGEVVPCVYVSAARLGIDDLVRLGREVESEETFRRLRAVPSACAACRHVESCRGGCASRRVLAAGLDRPDPFCPVVRGEERSIRASLARDDRPRPKASSACTTILSGYRDGPGTTQRRASIRCSAPPVREREVASEDPEDLRGRTNRARE